MKQVFKQFLTQALAQALAQTNPSQPASAQQLKKEAHRNCPQAHKVHILPIFAVLLAICSLFESNNTKTKAFSLPQSYKTGKLLNFAISSAVNKSFKYHLSCGKSFLYRYKTAFLVVFNQTQEFRLKQQFFRLIGLYSQLLLLF